MSFLPARSTLAGATLTGAAVLEDALDGDPARITTAPDILREHGGYYNGAVFDVDNIHYWTSDFGSGALIVKRLISTGAAVLTVMITGAGAMGMQRWIDTDGTAYLLVGCYSLYKVARIRMSDGAYTLSAVLANRPVGVCKLPGSALDGPVWVLDSYNDTAYCREIDFATGAILRTLGAAQWGSIGSNVADRLVLANNAAVSLYDTAPTTPALLYTFNFTAPNLVDGAPGSSINATATTTQSCIPPRGCAVGPGNTIYVLLGNGMVDLLNIVAGTFTRVRTMDPDRDGASLPQAIGYHWAPFLDFSPDGKWMVECVAEGVTTQSVKWHRLTRIDDAVAEWTFTIPSGGVITVDSFSVPGCLGNSKGRASARRRSERTTLNWDDRRSSFLYSVDGGSTWVACNVGEQLDVAVAAGVSPMLRATMKPPSWLKPAAPRPWIAASDGVAGPILLYDDPSIVGPTSADPSSATTVSACRDRVKERVLATVATSVPDVRFTEPPRSTTFNAWLEANKGSQSLRKFEVSRTGEREDLEFCDPSVALCEEALTLVVTYPAGSLAGYYGDETVEDLEDVIEQDADALIDAIEYAGHYLSGEVVRSCGLPTIDKGDDGVWKLAIEIKVRYFRDRRF